MKKFLLILVAVLSLSMSNAKAGSYYYFWRYVSVSGGYAYQSFLNEMSDNYDYLSGPSVGVVVRPMHWLELGGFYQNTKGSSIREMDLTMYGGELKIRPVRWAMVFGKYGKFNAVETMVGEEIPELPGNVTSVGLRFETSTLRTFGVFLEGSYDMYDFDDYDLTDIFDTYSVKAGVTINLFRSY